MRKFLIFSTFVLIFGSLAAQQTITWQNLQGVTYAYVDKRNQTFMYGKATFSPPTRALEGKEVLISGYIIPGGVDGSQYYLSANPLATCFFCGGSGPESIIELRTSGRKEKYQLDEWVTIKGILRLNDKEMELTYALENAV
ncbi:MAG: DUF3299 domain-containing protein, partial [Bacteroidetes bacterium]